MILRHTFLFFIKITQNSHIPAFQEHPAATARFPAGFLDLFLPAGLPVFSVTDKACFRIRMNDD